MSFPRSYHVLYWLSQAVNVGAAVGFLTCAIFDVKHSAWWYLALVLGWVFFGAWRLAARAYFKQRDRALEQLWREARAEMDMLLARQARMEGREQ